MSKSICTALEECSQMLVNHTGWAYLDKMPTADQLDVITTYKDQSLTSKYVVVVFARDKQRVQFEKRVKILAKGRELYKEDE